MLIVIEVCAIVATAVLGYLWVQQPTGNYEPWTVICGVTLTIVELIRRKRDKVSHSPKHSRTSRLLHWIEENGVEKPLSQVLPKALDLALLRRGLMLFGIRSEVEIGKTQYNGSSGQRFELDHAWIRTESDDIVDGNIDVLAENPYAPNGLEPHAYWGPRELLPSDRVFSKTGELNPDREDFELDMEDIRRWWSLLTTEIAQYTSRGE